MVTSPRPASVRASGKENPSEGVTQGHATHPPAPPAPGKTSRLQSWLRAHSAAGPPRPPAGCGQLSPVRPRGTARPARDMASSAPHRSEERRGLALAAIRLSPAHTAFSLKKIPNRSAPGPFPPVAGGRMRFAGFSRLDSARVSCRTWYRPPRCPASAPHLNHVVVQVLRVSVDQVDLFGVHVVHRLFAQLICHHLVVGLVDVALLPDGRRVQKSLREAEGAREGGESPDEAGRGGQGRAGPRRAGGRAAGGGPGSRGQRDPGCGASLARLFNRGRGAHTTPPPCQAPAPAPAARRPRPRGVAPGRSEWPLGGVGAGAVLRARQAASRASRAAPSSYRPRHAALALPPPLR